MMVRCACFKQDKCKPVLFIHVFWRILIVVLNAYLQRGKKQRWNIGRLRSTLNRKCPMSITSKKGWDRKYWALKTHSFQGQKPVIKIMGIYFLSCTFNIPLGSFVAVKIDFDIRWRPLHKDPLLLLADNFKQALHVLLARKMELTNEQSQRIHSFFSVLKAIWKKKKKVHIVYLHFHYIHQW